MTMETNMARANLKLAIADFARDLPTLDSKRACARLAWLRHQATKAECLPAAVLADGLTSALLRDGPNVPLTAWLDALSIAAGCDSDATNAGPLLMATVGVRFAA